MAKAMGQQPPEVAKAIIAAFPANDMLEDPTVAGKGFINLRLKPDFLAKAIQGIATDPKLGVAPVASESPQVVRQRLEQSIDGAGLRPTLAQLSVNGSLFDVRFRGVPHAAWLAWLDLTVRDTRLRVIDAAVTRDASPGLVSARVSLELPRQEAR